MKICTADQKKRVRLPGVTPGVAYQVREIGPGHMELIRLIPQETGVSLSPEELEDRWNRFGLKPRMSWEELRRETREL